LSDDFDIWFNRRKKYFDDFFRAIDKIFEESFNQYAPDESEGSRKRPEPAPFLYGYSITIGPDGKPTIREFGNFNTRRLEGEEKGPPIDVFERRDEVRVIVDMPGVSEDNIRLALDERSLKITVEGAKRYNRIVQLPSKVNPETMKSTYRNGILEISIKKLS